MKQGTILYLVAAAAAYYFFFNRKKNTTEMLQEQQSAAKTAKRMVADIVDNTTFIPDDTTFKNQYAQDQKYCR